MEEKLKIAVYGFTAEELKTWPDDIIPVLVETLPLCALVVIVHQRAASKYYEEAKRQGISNKNLAAVIFVPRADIRSIPYIPEMDIEIFSPAFVHQRQWDLIRKFAECGSFAELHRAQLDVLDEWILRRKR
jgi:hypothetical protein